MSILIYVSFVFSKNHIYPVNFLVFFLTLQNLTSQPLIENVFPNETLKLLYDSGSNWNNISSIRSFREEDFSINYNSDLDLPSTYYKILAKNKNINFNIYGSRSYNKYFYTYYDITLNQNHFIRNEQNRRRNENFTFKINSSGIGFQNEWVILQIGKGVENWGAGNDIKIGLSSSSEPYDYLMLSSNYGSIRVNYIHGFLENIPEQINRFIVARGIEWSNMKNKIIGLSETIIYSGSQRSLDFGYLNPIGSHLEIELNNRLNMVGNRYSNAIWQLHMDFLIKKASRISLNYLIDEFVFDPNIELNKDHGEAFFSKDFNFNYFKSKRYPEFVHIFRKCRYHNLRHLNGHNNFVTKGLPLGWVYGSDGNEMAVGLSYLKKDNFILGLAISYVKNGEKTLIKNPYDPVNDYTKGQFPSGSIKNFYNLRSDLLFMINQKYHISKNFILDYHTKNKKEFRIHY